MSHIEDAYDEFHRKVGSLIGHSIPLNNGTSTKLSDKQINNAARRCTNSNTNPKKACLELHNELVNHLEEISAHFHNCSTVEGFMKAFDFRHSKELSPAQAKTIKAAGGKLFSSTSTSKICVLHYQQGIVLSPNKYYVLATKCNGDKFDDKLNKKTASIEYFPNLNITGPLRFKWMEELSTAFDTSMIIIVAIWFKCGNEHKFCISPAKVISNNDTSDYGKSICKPLSLQLITVAEADKLIKEIKTKL